MRNPLNLLNRLLQKPKPQPDFSVKLTPTATITMKIIRADGMVEDGPPVTARIGT